MTTRATSRLVPMFGAAVFLMAQPERITPFTGTCKLNSQGSAALVERIDGTERQTVRSRTA